MSALVDRLVAHVLSLEVRLLACQARLTARKSDACQQRVGVSGPHSQGSNLPGRTVPWHHDAMS